ncbi:hypothetical protein AB4Y42_35905 [Paraburkholderia sp. EG286B]|uniref:hypothetical protein n=1 Tax=Paraburkholderia sp. EG286B TaxID=3237011 RepID=UPI0034D1B50E
MNFDAHKLVQAPNWREPERSARIDANKCFHQGCERACGGRLSCDSNDARVRDGDHCAGDVWPGWLVGLASPWLQQSASLPALKNTTSVFSRNTTFLFRTYT